MTDDERLSSAELDSEQSARGSQTHAGYPTVLKLFWGGPRPSLAVETMNTVEQTKRVPASWLARVRTPRSTSLPLLVLLGGIILIALGAGLVAAHVTAFALDETLIEQSAVHYTTNFPHSLFHDPDARATDRLYSLVLSIAFRLFNGPSAVEFDHVLSVVLFVSAAVPIYLVARVILRSPWPAAAVALLSVAVPWLTLTSALFTENLSYPLFWWMILATCNAVWRPSIRNDAIALAAIALLVTTRVQFAAVFVGYVGALLWVGILRSDKTPGSRRRFASLTNALVRRSGLTLVVVAGLLAGFVYLRASGQWGTDVTNALGSYTNVVVRSALPPNMAEGLLVELIALALGVGLLPAIVSLVWYAKQMIRPRLDQSWIYVCASGVVLFFFLILTVFAQNGYLGPLTEERYFFYVIPVFWLGMFAALRDRTVRPGELVASAVGLAALFGAIPFLSPLNGETVFLAPAESVVPHVLTQRINQFGLTGLTVQDALAAVALVAGVAAASVWRCRARTRLWWMVGIASIVQLLVTGYAFAVVTGHVQGIVGRTGGSLSPLGWVDSHARSQPVTWLDNLSTAAPPARIAAVDEDQQRATLFWNPGITSWAALPQLGLPPPESPVSALAGFFPLEVNHATGSLVPGAAAAQMREVVGGTDSPFLQLAGTSLARSPDGVLTLTAVSRPVRATWLAQGLQPDGFVAAGPPVHVYAFSPASPTPTALRLSFIISPLAAVYPVGSVRQTVLTLRLANVRRKISLAVGAAPLDVDISVCVPPGDTVVVGTIVASRPARSSGRTIAGAVDSVRTGSFAAPGCAVRRP